MERHFTPARAWWQFVAWTACGAGLGLVFAGAFTFGIAGFAVAAVFAALAVGMGGLNHSALGMITGVGAWALVIGVLNSDGPGTVCRGSSSDQTCTEQWSPWPFWLAGAIMILLPPIVFAMARRPRATLPR